MKKFQKQTTEKAEQIQSSIDAEIAMLENDKRKYIEKLDELNNKLPKIEEALNAKGLEITKVTTKKSHCLEEHWTPDTALIVEIKTQKKNGKFKFIQFAGYKANGEGKNVNRLSSKAIKLDDYLKKETGVKISINMYSLEVIDKDEKGTVLITAWL